jgi:hypothetical protein
MEELDWLLIEIENVAIVLYLLGTVEFIMDSKHNFYFMEMNTSGTSCYRDDHRN